VSLEVYLEAQSSFEGKIYLDVCFLFLILFFFFFCSNFSQTSISFPQVEPHPVLPIRVIPNGTTTNYLTLKNFNLSSVSFKVIFQLF